MDTQGVETAAGEQLHVRDLRQACRLAAVVIVGLVVYVALDIIAQRLTGQNPIGQAESDLATDPSYGLIMSVNFVVRGVVALALIAALHKTLSPAAHSRIGAVLVEVWGVGAFILAISPTDVTGKHSIHGLIHLVVALLAFVAGAIGELLISARLGRDPTWAPLRLPLIVIAAAAVLTLVVLIPATGAVANGAAGIFGLVERIIIGLVLLWMLVVALQVLAIGKAAAA